MKAIDAMLCWNDGGAVAVLPWPDIQGLSNNFDKTALAAWSHYRSTNDAGRVLTIYVEAMQAIVRDGVDPVAMHHALMAIDEYREVLADDMPGMS